MAFENYVNARHDAACLFLFLTISIGLFLSFPEGFDVVLEYYETSLGFQYSVNFIF